MKKILVIDDVSTVLESLKLTFAEAFKDIVFDYESDFDAGLMKVSSMRPDAVVLDLRNDPSPSELPGQKIWEVIWESHFCPVAIYTAVDDSLDPPIPEDYPFVKRVTKGRDAEAKLVQVIGGFLPGIEAIASLRSELESVINKALRETAGSGLIDSVSKDHLLHMGRRRVAASMDDPTLISNRKLTSWEQYLLPAIGNSPLTADLLREHEAGWDEPTAYRLVLTPSCDLVKDQRGCVQTLVVARCEGVTRLAERLALPSKEGKAVTRVIDRALTTGIYAGFIPLPGLPGQLPLMVANLKDLEVMPYEAIGRTDPSQPRFKRVASIDSPFREQVAWAFLTTIARPGMPERDLDPWAMEIVKDAAKAGGTSSPAQPQ